jgi:type IV secretion system protein VirB10
MTDDEAPNVEVSTRRATRLPIYLVAGFCTLLVAGIAYTAYNRERMNAQGVADAEKGPTDASPNAFLKHASETSGVRYQPVDERPADKPVEKPSVVDGMLASFHGMEKPAQPEVPKDEADARAAGRKKYFNELAEIEDQRFRAQHDAMGAQIGHISRALADHRVGATPVADRKGPPDELQDDEREASESDANGLRHRHLRHSETSTRSRERWLNQAGDDGSDTTIRGRIKPLVSPYAVLAGDIIPAATRDGISSDVPGQLVGVVTRNVCDSVTGHTLLIPQGSLLLGQYNTAIATGQERIQTILTRIRFPDGSSISLGSQPGVDAAGFGGFADTVDHHLFAKFGNAMILGLAGAAVQLSQPQASNGQNYSATQIGAAQLGQQFSQLGQEYARQGLSIPNTILIRPGYEFNLRLTKDLVLKPYEGWEGC